MASGLQKVKLVSNPHYKASGIKSYAWLLNKWGFNPTKPGPFVRGSHIKQQGHAHVQHNILRKVNASGKTGEVSAEDIQYDAMYLCPVSIGTPAQTLNLDFDTGSADLWCWSTELPSATQKTGSHNVYDPSKSSTYKKQTGSTWQISYGDSSSASGTVGTDNVTIGGLTIKNQAVELASKMSTQFMQSEGDGLLGLAFGSINTVKPKAVKTPVENMIAQDDISSSSELFTCKLGSWRDANEPDKGESFYTFGYVDQDTMKAAGASEAHWAPVDNSQGFWMINSTSAVVNGTTTTRSGNTAIMDTGTTLCLVSDELCEAIYKAIPNGKYDESSQGWVYPTDTKVADLPVVTVAIGDKQFTIQKEDLGFVEASSGWIYGGIQSRGDMTFDIFGDTVLKGIYAIWDVGNMRFGCVERPEKYQNITPPAETS
ncbi:MAG: hypothetical protein M1834_007943 [Cirrosporium novae-zelandiae]|nr:MAG: hypothetical protein M1834_007943 [Cirrosporium novae-zelandiae]